MLYPDAEHIFTSFKTLNASCHCMLLDVVAAGVMQDRDALRLLVGTFMGNVYIEVLRPLERLFAQLDPMSTDSKYLAPAEEGGDDARLFARFIGAARQALSLHSAAIVDGEASGLFRKGTLQEIVDAVDAIERFAGEHGLHLATVPASS